MENNIVGLPEVLEASVIGISHPKWQERPLALVVLKEEFKGKVDNAHVLDHLGKTFAQWQLPDKILFVDEIAKTSVGKANKKALRELYGKIYSE
jgi:fatty-acyl-CoA synthase